MLDGAGQALTISVSGGARATQVALISGYAEVDASPGDDGHRRERCIAQVTWQFPDGTSVGQTLDPSTRGVQSIPVPGAPQAGRIVLPVDATTPGDVTGDHPAISTSDVEGR